MSPTPHALLASLLWLTLLASCSLDLTPRPSGQLTVMTWNVENLFDDVDDGTEYPEFDPQKGWSRADFWQRCESLAKVIRTATGQSSPDLLVLEEVESPRALEVLNSRFLGDLGYRFTFITPPESQGMRTAFLSRYPLLNTGVHWPETPAEGSLRPILEVELDLGGRHLVVLANHWKSRIPTPGATEGQRAVSGQLLGRRLGELQNREDHPLVLAVGDFNTSVDLSRPWPQPSMKGSFERTLIGGVELTDPWPQAGEPRGSYFYHGDWNALDHMFVLASSLLAGDWAAENFHPVRFAPQPLPWGPRTRNGVSDHFPLLLTLVRRA
ncbi:MAG: endonuclease/exonuclease/phosphatase family protein [Spirochaetales bacterium]